MEHRSSDPGPGIEMKGTNAANAPPAGYSLLAGAENAGEGASEKHSFEAQLQRARLAAERFGEDPIFASIMSVITIYTLYQSDIRLAGTDKEADEGFLVVASIIFFVFLFEIFLQSFYKPDYCIIPKWEAEPHETWTETWWRRLQIGSFYFWLDWIATLTLIFDLSWMLGSASDVLNGGGQASNAAGAAKNGARAGRVIRLVRMVRLIRMVKVYKYVKIAYSMITGQEIEIEEEEDTGGSRVGAAMSDLTNRRVIVLILLMLIIIPTLTVNDEDASLSIAASMIHNLAVQANLDPTTYQTGLDLAIRIVYEQLPLIKLTMNGVNFIYDSTYDGLRDSEMSTFELSTGEFVTYVAFDQKSSSVQEALFSIYTTTFVIVLLLVGIYFFSADVNRLVIGPIERLVDLVRKISANPLGVEYKMLGEKEGFIEGMETTILLTTITKIGALMRVGFGEAGASVIAKNLSESSGGKLNLMGSGTMINSIFGFCDVRQFTDTTECLQEEVMLFVNRIAHILHNIVVQCSGAANKNIGDAFLLTWKIDDKLTAEQISSLADQALLTFCKALIELSRYQDFICNFSVSATARLLKRFPDYSVRIGSGLHVGWAIEGAIGSNRKIDASYLSPHVGATEFLESSTKAYGVSLLMSEPFAKLLSPAAMKYVRQVDRIRRSEFEDPMGLYTYDMDLSINWNDPYRNMSRDPKQRLQLAAKRALQVNQAPSNVRRGTVSTGNAAHLNTDSSEDNTPNALVGRKKSKTDSGSAAATTSGAAAAARSGSGVGAAPGTGRKNSTFGHPPKKGVLHGLPHVPIPSLNEVDETGDLEAADDAAAAEAREKSKATPTIVLPPYTQQVWTEDNDLVDLRHRISDSFRAIWQVAIDAYIAGDWEKARGYLEETLAMSKGTDGPSKNLLDFINSHGGVAPKGWEGYRMDAD